MPKVYCLHHWIGTTTKECTICGEKWDPVKDKEPPQIAIGTLADYAPVFTSSDADMSDIKSSGIPAFCNHIWESFGPGTVRCLRCRGIWKKFEDPKEPQIVIGFIANS